MKYTFKNRLLTALDNIPKALTDDEVESLGGDFVRIVKDVVPIHWTNIAEEMIGGNVWDCINLAKYSDVTTFNAGRITPIGVANMVLYAYVDFAVSLVEDQLEGNDTLSLARMKELAMTVRDTLAGYSDDDLFDAVCEHNDFF